MGINLEKGQRTGLSKQKFNIGLSWDANETDSGGQFDLDASVFGLSDNGKLVSEDYFIFYNHLQTSDKSITHTGDNQSGVGDGDDETIEVDLSKIDSKVKEIRVVVTIHDASNRKQNFGQVRNSKIRIYVPGVNEELLKYELDEDYSTETALEFGRIYNKDDNWKFEAVGSGMAGGLDAFLKKFS
jgi:tellurium resistance protein TerD